MYIASANVVKYARNQLSDYCFLFNKVTVRQVIEFKIHKSDLPLVNITTHPVRIMSDRVYKGKNLNVEKRALLAQ